MTGIRKRSSDPRADQKKIKINPLYNTSAIIKSVGDTLRSTLGTDKKKTPKKKGR